MLFAQCCTDEALLSDVVAEEVDEKDTDGRGTASSSFRQYRNNVMAKLRVCFSAPNSQTLEPLVVHSRPLPSLYDPSLVPGDQVDIWSVFSSEFNIMMYTYFPYYTPVALS